MKTNLSKTFKSLSKASPLLLTIVGVAGVIGTAVLTAKCTPKALKRIEEKQEKRAEQLRPMEKALAAAPAYLPAAGAGAITIFAIVSSNLLSHKQNLSLAATCTLIQHNFKNYKSKVIELFGEQADKDVEKEISKETFRPELVLHADRVTSEQLYLWYEPTTGQYFWASEADVLRAEYEVNHMLSDHWSCTLYDYCELLNILAPEGSENVGWCCADFAENWDTWWVEFQHEFVDFPDDENIPPYYIIHTPISPEWNFAYERRESVELKIDDVGCYAYDVR